MTSKKIYNEAVNIQFAYSAAHLRSNMRGCKFMKVTGRRIFSSVLAVVSIVGMMSANSCALDYWKNDFAGIASASSSTAYVTPPTNFTITYGDTYADISWEPVKGANQYNIFMYDEETGEYKYNGFTRSATYRVALRRNVTYKFKFDAERNMEVSEKSEEVSVKTTTIPAPTVGKNLWGQENEFMWTEIFDADYYKVYRYNTKTKKYKLIGETKSRHYIDDSVKYGKTYSYKVSAVCDDGTSKLSEEYTLTIPDMKELSISAEFRKEDIELKWNNTSDAYSYNVYKYNTKTKKYTLVKNTTSWPRYYDEKIKPGKTYSYKVCPVGKYGKGKYSNIVSVTVPDIELPAIPVIKNYKSSTYSVSFSWNAVNDAAYYKIYKYNPDSKKYELYDTTSTTSMSIGSLSSNTTYYFKVAATNLKGTGSLSKQIKITTDKETTNSGSSSDHSLTWVCPACGTTNYDFGGWSFACTNCKNMKPTKDTWTCPRCGTTNFNWGTGICTNCKNLKP